MNKICVLILLAVFTVGCNQVKKSSETDDRAIVVYYKQFDSTITKERLDSFKTVLDARNKWRDSKIKRRF